MVEGIVFLLVFFSIVAYHLYSTVYKETNSIKIVLIFFLLYSVPVIFYIYSGNDFMFLLYLILYSLNSLTYSNSHKKKNERIVCSSKLLKSYSYNELESFNIFVLLINATVIIGLFLILKKIINYQTFHYIVYLISIGIVVYASTIKYFKIYIFEDKCIFADKKINTINYSEYNSYKIIEKKIVFCPNNGTHKTFKPPSNILLELEKDFSKIMNLHKESK